MTVGVAVTEEPVLADKVAAGDHEYVDAPEAFNVVDVPAQIDVFGLDTEIDAELTTIVVEEAALHGAVPIA